jgi:hypothetical protein
MQIAQTIVDYIISQMASVVGFDGYGIAIKDAQGKVVSLSVSESGERQFWGLDDTMGSKFYFRQNGNPTETRATAGGKIGSCGTEIIQRLPLKLVGQHPCASPSLLIDYLKYALFTTKFRGVRWDYDISEIKIFPITYNAVPWEVYAAETGKDAKSLVSNLQIISVDLVLQFQYSYSDKCIAFSVCPE